MREQPECFFLGLISVFLRIFRPVFLFLAVEQVAEHRCRRMAALQNDVAGIDGNLSVATSVQVVESTVTTAIDDLDELADLDF